MTAEARFPPGVRWRDTVLTATVLRNRPTRSARSVTVTVADSPGSSAPSTQTRGGTPRQRPWLAVSRRRRLVRDACSASVTALAVPSPRFRTITRYLTWRPTVTRVGLAGLVTTRSAAAARTLPGSPPDRACFRGRWRERRGRGRLRCRLGPRPGRRRSSLVNSSRRMGPSPSGRPRSRRRCCPREPRRRRPSRAATHRRPRCSAPSSPGSCSARAPDATWGRRWPWPDSRPRWSSRPAGALRRAERRRDDEERRPNPRNVSFRRRMEPFGVNVLVNVHHPARRGDRHRHGDDRPRQPAALRTALMGGLLPGPPSLSGRCSVIS